MTSKSIQLPGRDALQLRKMLDQGIRGGEITNLEAAKLQSELDRAEIVETEALAAGVVTMNSSFELLDQETGEVETYTLVFPGEADVADGKVSVLAPIGTAVLGYRVGDAFLWEVPSGIRKLKIERVHQPLPTGLPE